MVCALERKLQSLTSQCARRDLLISKVRRVHNVHSLIREKRDFCLPFVLCQGLRLPLLSDPRGGLVEGFPVATVVPAFVGYVAWIDSAVTEAHVRFVVETCANDMGVQHVCVRKRCIYIKFPSYGSVLGTVRTIICAHMCRNIRQAHQVSSVCVCVRDSVHEYACVHVSGWCA
jgi:hypothetical protein